MTSKERVYKTIFHQEPDRIPLYIWYHPDVIKYFESDFKCKGKELEVALGNDILQTWTSINYFQSQILEEGQVYIDEYGIEWKRMGGYNMITANPIADWETKDLCDYKFPDPNRPGRFDELSKIIKDFGKEKFIGSDISGIIFEPCSAVRGMEKFLIDLYSDEKSVDVFLDNAMNFSLQVALNSIELDIDWIWLGDDLGTQSNMIISPALWRKLFKPRVSFIIEELRKKRKNLIVAYHSCGAISPILDDLYEIGINVLNPIQPLATGMNPYEIKKKYRNKLALHCGIDTQDILPFAPIEHLEEEMKNIIRGLAPGGGFIFTATHTIQPDTSKERVLMVLDILKKYGNYPINI